MDILPKVRGWFSRRVDREIANDKLKLSDRIGQIFVAIAIIVATVLLIYVQTNLDVGFFTTEFGPLEMLALYGPLVFGVAPATILFVTGSRNRARPWEMLGSILFFIGGLYLLIIFPFDFSVLPNVLPENVRYLLDWLSNEEARILWALGVFINIASANYAFWMHRAVKERMIQRKIDLLQLPQDPMPR